MSKFFSTRLNKRVIVDPKFTAQDWGLYGDGVLCRIAASELNRCLAYCVESQYTREQTLAGMNKLRTDFAAEGAADSDCLLVLNCILDEIYGD